MRSISLIFLLAMTTNSLANSPIRYHISFDGRDHNEAIVTVTFPDVANSPLEIRMSRTSPQENARLKRAVADLTLDKLILKEAAEGNW